MSLIKKLIAGTALAASLAGCWVERHIPEEVITVDPERYAWVDAKKDEGTNWEAYMNEGISHNTVAWESYQKLVKRGNSQGVNYLPDVDGNGCVILGKKKDRREYCTSEKPPHTAESELK